MTARELTIEDVRRMIGAGVSGRRLERVIERLGLDPDEEAALRLDAGSDTDPADPRQPVPGLYLG